MTEVFLQLAFFPLLLAVGITYIVTMLGDRSGLSAAVFAVIVCLIFVASEGLPPFPPISAKQKVPYLLAVVTLSALIINRFGPNVRSAWAAALLCGGFVWLVQRQLFAGNLQIHWVLPVFTVPMIVSAVRHQAQNFSSRFAWPVTLLVIMTTTSIVALLGGFIGVGQVMVSLSVFFGGVVFVMFLDALRKTGAKMGALPSSILWVLTAAIGILLILIGIFATNLSSSAYLLILAMIFVPYAERRVARHPLWLQPFLFSAIAALPAVPAIVLAVFNF